MSNQRKFKQISVYLLSADPNTDKPAFYLTKSMFDRLVGMGEIRRVGERAGKLTYAGPFREQCGTKLSMENAHIVNPPRYGRCEICGFDRSFEYAHIIPARFGGPKTPDNLLNLCPNHHTMFDRDLLTWVEMEKIWPRVSAALANAIDDKRLDSWRAKLVERYSVSIPTQRQILENSSVRTYCESRC